jgi:hypothetical protein
MSGLRELLDDAYDQSLHGQIIHSQLAAANERRQLAVRHANRLADELADEREAHEQTREVAELYELWTSLLFLLFLAAILGKGVII